jgi:putative PIG3 family NAD(P)H quinone oxidoreductase
VRPRRTEEKKKEPTKKKSPSPVRATRRRSPSPVKHSAAAPHAAQEEIKDTMKCVVAQRGTLAVEERATPKPGKEEVLVRVRAAGLNQADLLQAQGKYPPPSGASDVLGLELAGTIAKVGFAMKDYWGVGDRVCGLVAGGGYGEYAVVHGDSLIELPERMSFEEGAGVAEAFLTAYQALFLIADLKNRVKDRKQNILIWGASGGVGSAAVQLARHLPGENTRVLAVASTAEKCQFVKQMGAHVAINRKEDDLARIVERECDGKGIDVLIDLVGAANFGANLKVMAVDSVMVMLGFLSGSQCSETELRDILAKRITIKGSTLRSRDDQYKGILTQSFVEDFGSQLERKTRQFSCLLSFLTAGRLGGVLKVEVDRKFELDACNDAHAYMAESKHKGKIIFTM